jgi:hypothetical protein
VQCGKHVPRRRARNRKFSAQNAVGERVKTKFNVGGHARRESLGTDSLIF